MVFLFVFFLDVYDSNVGVFNIVRKVSDVVLISFNSFFFFPLCLISFHHSIFHHTYPIFCYLLYCWSPSECFWSQLFHYSLLIDSFFIYSRSLLNICCIFSILVSSLFIYNSILFSRLWIIFTIIILNYFSGRFPNSSFVWCSGHLSCSFPCWIFLCHFIWFRLLCLWWPFSILAVCGSSLMWNLLPMVVVGLVACQGFLVGEACVCVLVGGTGLLSGVHWSVQ